MRNRLRFVLTAVGVVAAIFCFVAPVSAAQANMKIDPRLQVATVCLPVTDPLGLPRTLYGKRYTTSRAGSITCSLPHIAARWATVAALGGRTLPSAARTTPHPVP